MKGKTCVPTDNKQRVTSTKRNNQRKSEASQEGCVLVLS